jgi:hypothetical protein
MPFITFKKFDQARTGNCIFQYLYCKLIGLLYGHTYVPFESFNATQSFLIKEEDAGLYVAGDRTELRDKHIVCEGYFQKGDFFVPYRDPLLRLLAVSEDVWFEKGVQRTIHEFFHTTHPYTFLSRDVVISLRLDDFIQLPCPTSDIVPPTFYTELLETMWFERLYIVCDQLRHGWEHKYMEYFQKWNPVLIQGSLLNDCAVMRDAPTLIHSNSTLCWIMSFFGSGSKRRIIPRTYFYKGQDLGVIETTDRVIRVQPLRHQEVYALDVSRHEIYNYLPMPYAIPDEYVVDAVLIPKSAVVAEVKPQPAHNRTYTFSVGQEDAYYQTYRDAHFASTAKKGGWDCLRHYEILASGCIPLFHDLVRCPSQTMVSFPKELCLQAAHALLPWRAEHGSAYRDWAERIRCHVKQECTTSALARSFLSKFPASSVPRKVLLLRCHEGVNYLREFFWIGLKRHLVGAGGMAVEWPPIEYLYKGNTIDKQGLHGRGFGYTDRLDMAPTRLSEEEVRKSIQEKAWDLVVFGKTGPDEGHEGGAPYLPFWSDILAHYGKDQIAFLYGGDECIDLTHSNRYREHIKYHSQYGKCFVRELRTTGPHPRLRVGVAIPSFQRDLAVLKRCFDSIEGQSRRPDVVAISISSTQLKDVAAALSDYSFPVRLSITDCPQNAAENRNVTAALLLKDTDVISFVDSDGEMLTRRVEYIERAFLETGCDYIVHNFVCVRSKDTIELPMYTDYAAFPELLIPNPDPWGGVILKPNRIPYTKKEIHNGHVSIKTPLLISFRYNEDASTLWFEDSAFNKKLATSGCKGTYLVNELTRYHCYR